jgi:hypothetical protein
MMRTVGSGAPTLLPLVALFALVQSSSTAKMSQPATRPALVEQALQSNTPLYYFGLGSNMLRSKLENRSAKGRIEAMSFEPAVVHNHRLAFNMRGFVPLEPAMGSLEPTDDDGHYQEDKGEPNSRPLLAYERPECHGALVLLTPEDYEKVMESEGISKNNLSSSGYEEVVVTAVPYDTSKPPVQAVALRARPHVRLRRDPAPSKRYMQILRDGAAELGLAESYQSFLAAHPVQQTPAWMKKLAVHNLIFTFTLNTAMASRDGASGAGGNPMARRSLVSKVQTWLLFRCYVPPTQSAVRRIISDAAMAVVLLPGAVAGAGIRWYRHVSKTEHPPFMRRILGLVHETPPAATPAVATTTPEKVAA